MGKNFHAGDFKFSSDKKTYIMGILNITPDSFVQDSRYLNPDTALKRAIEMQAAGVDIIDIGGQSTRPGYSEVSKDEELRRLLPVFEKLKGKIKIPTSIDTYYPEVAKVALSYGASIVNDIHGFKDENMWDIAQNTSCGCILMHSGSAKSFGSFLKANLEKISAYKLDPDRFCFDPGIGFGKSYEEDLYFIKNAGKYIADIAKKNFCLMGVSNKRVIKNSSGAKNINDRIYGTIAANVISAINGANIVRVHNVEETILAMKTTDSILKQKHF